MAHHLRAQKPTAESISEFVTAHSRLLEQSLVKWARNDTFFNQTFEVWPGHEGRDKYHTPIARSRVLQPLKTQFSYEVKYHREPVGKAEDAEAWADLVENWLQAMSFELAASSIVSPYKGLVRQLLTYGKAVGEGLRWKAPPDSEEPEREADEDQDQHEARLAAWEHDQRSFFPFKASVVHPSFFVADPYERNPSECVIRKALKGYEIERLVLRKQQVKARYPVSSVLLKLEADSYDAGAKRYEPHEVEEYWNANWHSLKIKGGRSLFVEANTHGYVPYRQYYSGNGGEQADSSGGTNTGLRDPVDLAQGVYEGLEGILRVIDQQASLRHYMIVRKATASVAMKSRDANAVKTATDIAHGDTVFGVSPDDIDVIKYPDVTNDMFSEKAVLDQYLIDGSFPPSLHGEKIPGVDTGVLNAQLSKAMNRLFDGEAQAEADLATWHGESALRLLDYYGDPVTIGNLTIERKHIGHVYTVKAAFPNVDPNTEAIEAAQDERWFQMGVIDMETLRKRRGIEDNAGMNKGVLKDYVRNHPSVKDKAAITVAEEMGAPFTPTPPQQNGAKPSGGLLGPNGQPIPQEGAYAKAQ